MVHQRANHWSSTANGNSEVHYESMKSLLARNLSGQPRGGVRSRDTGQRHCFIIVCVAIVGMDTQRS